MIWDCGKRKIECDKEVLIMGIVNVTPDSFSDGGKWFDNENAVNHAVQLVNEGADILDFGAQSTRPGYEEISPEEEWQRLEPVLTEIRGMTDVPISVDTYFPYVAEKALHCGVDIINDVSGIVHPKMAQIVKKSRCGWILMHNGAGSVNEVKAFFKNAVQECLDFGIEKKQLCLDMGIGFGKNYEENLDLLANCAEYRMDDIPLLLGTSRKRVIGTSSRQPDPLQRTYGNIAADTAAILGGVNIIRLHDVKNEKQGILTAQEIKRMMNNE